MKPLLIILMALGCVVLLLVAAHLLGPSSTTGCSLHNVPNYPGESMPGHLQSVTCP